jgi:adenosylcobyric acid synthase
MANFTDFDALALEPSVSLAFLQQPEEMLPAVYWSCPAKKQTLDDLCGLIVEVLPETWTTSEEGIVSCGGFQMLGSCIEDPHGIENQGEFCERNGLGFLPVRTVLQPEKTVRGVHGRLRTNFFDAGLPPETRFEGYEIHVGESFYEPGSRPIGDIVRRGILGSGLGGAGAHGPRAGHLRAWLR